MNEILPSAFESPDHPKRTAERPKHSMEAIEASHDKSLQQQAEIRQTEIEKEGRRNEIAGFLMDLYVDPSSRAFLEPYEDNGQFPEQVTDTLRAYEKKKQQTKPEYDITKKPVAIIVGVLDRHSEKVEARQEVESTETNRNKYVSLVEKLRQDGKSTTDIIRQLAEHPDTPESERGKLQALSKIIALARTAEDRRLIEGKLNEQNLAALPDPATFISFEIFSSSGYDTGISEETQNAIAQEFGLDRPQPIDTGSDVREAATKTQVNPQTGEAEPAHTEEHPAPIRPGVTAHTVTGDEIILKAHAGSSTIKKDVTGWSDEDIGLLAEALGFWTGTEEFGATGFVESVYKIDFSILSSDAFDPIKLTEIRQKLTYLVGGLEGYDGDIFDVREKKGLIRYQMRLLSEDGEATGWENDQAATERMVKKFGLDEPNALKAFGDYTQTTYLTGDATAEDLQKYLTKKSPERNSLHAPPSA